MAVSAYHATVSADADGAYVATTDSAYRLAVSRAPVKRTLDLGYAQAFTRDRFVYWSKGAIREALKAGGDEHKLIETPAPQRIAASEERIVWVNKAPADKAAVGERVTIRTLENGRILDLYTTTGTVDALSLAKRTVYFVERDAQKGWRFGVTSGVTAPRFGEWKAQGRSPAMLALAEDLFYYDGPTYTVRRVSADLQRESVIAKEMICTPLAVARHLYCAQPAGLLELGLDGVTRRTFPMPQGPITALSVWSSPGGRGRIVWLVDSGADQLEVQTLALDAN